MVADGSDQGQELLTKETLEEAKTLTNVEAAASEILTHISHMAEYPSE